MARSIKVLSTPQATQALDAKLLGQYVRAKRTQSGLRIDDAAQLCGVSVETISRIETAKNSVRLESLFRVLSGLGLQLRIEPWKS